MSQLHQPHFDYITSVDFIVQYVFGNKKSNYTKKGAVVDVDVNTF